MSIGTKISEAKRRHPANRKLLQLVHKIDRNSRAAAKLASAKMHAAQAFETLKPRRHWEELQDTLEILESCLHAVLAERKGFREALDREQQKQLGVAQ